MVETHETSCESCAKRVEEAISNGQSTTETMDLKCLDCKLKEKEEKANKLLKVIFI